MKELHHKMEKVRRSERARASADQCPDFNDHADIFHARNKIVSCMAEGFYSLSILSLI